MCPLAVRFFDSEALLRAYKVLNYLDIFFSFALTGYPSIVKVVISGKKWVIGELLCFF